MCVCVYVYSGCDANGITSRDVGSGYVVDCIEHVGYVRLEHIVVDTPMIDNLEIMISNGWIFFGKDVLLYLPCLM
jgi:hypothetical protein